MYRVTNGNYSIDTDWGDCSFTNYVRAEEDVSNPKITNFRIENTLFPRKFQGNITQGNKHNSSAILQTFGTIT